MWGLESVFFVYLGCETRLNEADFEKPGNRIVAMSGILEMVFENGDPS
jgi:hypothetical protein